MISLVYCGDRKMVPGIQLSVLSILENETEPLDIWVVTASTPQGQAIKSGDLSKLQTLLESKASQLHLFDLSPQFQANYPVANEGTIFNVNCMLRLFLDLIPNLPDKVLYLDTDVLCRKDFASFFHQSLGNHEFAGALDYYGRWVYHYHWNWRLMDCINSGVLLLNMKLIKATGLFKKCRHFCQVHRSFLPDEAALNRLAHHKKIVSSIYNDQHGPHPTTVFQHFTTHLKFFPKFRTVTVKPWDFKRVHTVLGLDQYDKLFMDYHYLFRQ